MTDEAHEKIEKIPRGPSGRPLHTELQRRADEAFRLLRKDDTIHPADALAMVVWPPKEVSCSDS